MSPLSLGCGKSNSSPSGARGVIDCRSFDSWLSDCGKASETRSSATPSIPTRKKLLDCQRLTRPLRAMGPGRFRPSPMPSQRANRQRITCCRVFLHLRGRLWLWPDPRSCMRRPWSCRNKWSRGSGRRWTKCLTRPCRVRRREQVWWPWLFLLRGPMARVWEQRRGLGQQRVSSLKPEWISPVTFLRWLFWQRPTRF